MPATSIEGAEGLLASTGREFASDWITIDQERVSRFADTTEDRQWIHVDPDRAARESPYGTTIAHGFLTLSLVSHLFEDTVRVNRVRFAINYGLNRVRFPSPVPAGSRVRARFRLEAVEPSGDALQRTWAITVEREGGEKPCCVAEWLVRFTF
jgi:acyl dehydratase